MEKNKKSIVAFIPARSGSKRVADKNIRSLAGHPLIAYTISAALRSGIFSSVIVSTDSEMYAEIALHYGAEVPFLRSHEISGEFSPDIEWVDYTLSRLRDEHRVYDCFSILRPTSPFRQPDTIRRAWNKFLSEDGVDSLRAVEKCKQHPGKMWVVRGNRMMPLMPLSPPEQPWHSSQYGALPSVYVQNASLEIAYSHVVFLGRSIAGNVVMPFFTDEYEGLDINTEYEFKFIEDIAQSGKVMLPEISVPPYQLKMN